MFLYLPAAPVVAAASMEPPVRTIDAIGTVAIRAVSVTIAVGLVVSTVIRPWI